MPVELSRLDVSLPAETTVAENVSPRGARVVSKQRWKEGDRVLVKALKGDLPFAIGLKPLATADWGETRVGSRATGSNNRTRKRNSKSQAPIICFPRVRGALTFKRRLRYFAATK